MYSCDLCSWKAASMTLINQHYRQKHAQEFMQVQVQSKSTVKKHACPYCDYKSNLIAHVKRHILIHTGETPFKCSHCEYKCRDSTVLKRHIERHSRNGSKQKKDQDDGGKYLCEKCAFSTSFKGAFSRHLLRHNEPKICNHCGKQFWTEKSYKNHILLHAGVALHQCKECEYKTNVASELRNHVKRHHVETKPWKCTECNYSTRCPSDLSKHKTVHKFERPFACDKCEYTSRRRSHLTVHSAIHNPKLKNYICPFCDFRTVHIGMLKIHVRSHTGEKPYNCDTCGAAYTSSAGVRSHAYTHIKNWYQTCPFCNFTARKPLLFKAHLKTHLNKTVASENNENSVIKLKQSSSNNSLPEQTTTDEQNRTATPPMSFSFEETQFYENPSLEPSCFDQEIITADPNESLIEDLESFFPVPMQVEPVKIEDIDIFYPVKQEYEP